MKRLLALPCLLLALDAAASTSCPRSVPAEQPQIPDGRIATETAMRESHAAVKSYVTEIENYLSCWEFALMSRPYNHMVDRAQTAADAYNVELNNFNQQTEEHLASN